MPTNYDLISTVHETQVVSPTATLDITKYGLLTKPSGVTAYTSIPAKVTDVTMVRSNLEAYALLIEQAMRLPGVVGSYPIQDVDASNLLSDYQVFVVEYVPPDTTRPTSIEDEVRIPAGYFATAAGFKKGVADPIARAYAFLQGVAE